VHDAPPADRFAGTDPDPVPDGGILTVHYRDPGHASQSVEIKATDGADPTDTKTVSLALRGNGAGKALFIVPAGWESVVLTDDAGATRTVAVALPP